MINKLEYELDLKIGETSEGQILYVKYQDFTTQEIALVMTWNGMRLEADFS